LIGSELGMVKNKIKISSNITLMVKKYVKCLFEENKLDIYKDEISFEQFNRVIIGHEKIFCSYF
jgi:hypothetical protein